MALRWAVVLGWFLFGTGCSTTRQVTLHTGQASWSVIPHEEADHPLENAHPDDEEFVAALTSLVRDVKPFRHPMSEARELFGMPTRSGVYRIEQHGQRLVPQQSRTNPDLYLLESYADEELTHAYGQWCQRKGRPGDCLRLLEEGPLLASDGKYTLAMAIAMGSVWEETAEAFEDMANPEAALSTVTASVTMYMLLWSLPEPVSKGVAAILTATAIAYLGVDTVLRLIDGWVTLVRRVDQATSFDQLREAGEVYGEVMGESAARIFVMLAAAAVGETAGLAAKSLRLPGSAQAAIAVETQGGYSYAALSSVESVAITTQSITIVLAPNAMAMAERGMSQKHHLATDKNSVSPARGGPWTPRFKKLFKKSGMELKDTENIVDVPGHKGPHPEEYHQLVFKRLNDATSTCRTVETCRRALTLALKELAKEAVTRGTDIHRLLTRRQSR
ncbi:AHH domain-containing protein [Corallococcus terminator]